MPSSSVLPAATTSTNNNNSSTSNSTSTTLPSSSSSSPPAASPYLNNARLIFPYTIDYTDPTLLRQGLRAVAREIVPGWATLLPALPPSLPPSSPSSSDEDVTITVISGGITNLLYRLSLPSSLPASPSASTPHDVIVRIYGRNTEVIIDREKENKLFAALSALEFAPVYWGRFGNGRIEGWLDARPLVPEELAKTGREGGREGGGEDGKEGGVDFVGMIAREMARMHALPVRMEEEGEEGREGGREGGEGGKAVLWEKMEEWARLAKDISFVEGEEGGREGERAKQAQLEAIGLDRLEEEMEWLKGQLLGEGGREGGRERARVFLREMVFSHQDLLCGNILYNPEWRREGGGEGGEGGSTSSSTSTPTPAARAQENGHTAVSNNGGREGGRVQFIDFEYGGWNHRGFDLGNHFCEYAGFDPDYEKSYPSQEQQEWFFKAYLEGWRGREGGREGGKEEGEEEEKEFLEGLYVWVNRYACAAHLFWGYWAVIQARYSPIDFDFLNYASQRLAGYEVFKKKYF